MSTITLAGDGAGGPNANVTLRITARTRSEGRLSHRKHGLPSALCRRMLTNRTERRSAQASRHRGRGRGCQHSAIPRAGCRSPRPAELVLSASHTPSPQPQEAEVWDHKLTVQRGGVGRRAPPLLPSFLLSPLQQSRHLRTPHHRFPRRKGASEVIDTAPPRRDEPILKLSQKAGHGPHERGLKEGRWPPLLLPEQSVPFGIPVLLNVCFSIL